MPAIELDDIFEIMDEIIDSDELDGWEAFMQLRERLAEKAAQQTLAPDAVPAENTAQ